MWEMFNKVWEMFNIHFKIYFKVSEKGKICYILLTFKAFFEFMEINVSYI